MTLKWMQSSGEVYGRLAGFPGSVLKTPPSAWSLKKWGR